MNIVQIVGVVDGQHEVGCWMDDTRCHLVGNKFQFIVEDSQDFSTKVVLRNSGFSLYLSGKPANFGATFEKRIINTRRKKIQPLIPIDFARSCLKMFGAKTFLIIVFILNKRCKIHSGYSIAH